MKKHLFSAAGLSIVALSVITTIVQAQAGKVIPFDSVHWNIAAGEVKLEDFKGRQCLRIVNGAATLKDQFKDGIVEFDIAFDKERCFPGLMFRIADPKNFEFLYLRPHQSGNPDAIQYCPVVYGNDSWQLYNGEGYCAQANFEMNAWIHVKVVISGTQGELFLNHSTTPVLYMYHIQREPVLGDMALDNHSPATVRFANFIYTKLDGPTLQSPPGKVRPLPDGLIVDWQISNSFDGKILDPKVHLDSSDLESLTWQSFKVEDLGFVNIGKYIAKTNERNTVFAKFSIHADKAEIKRMALGFSDLCKVYLNGKILYGGSNVFKSRDYRFYGTIGFWDEVYLDLKPGQNDIVIAVSENFGGWGIEAKLDHE